MTGPHSDPNGPFSYVKHLEMARENWEQEGRGLVDSSPASTHSPTHEKTCFSTHGRSQQLIGFLVGRMRSLHNKRLRV